MEVNMQATLAARRIFGIERKNRVKKIVSIEKEFSDVLDNGMNRSDALNISIQEFVVDHGIPILLVALEPEGVRVQPVNASDIYNLALGELLKKKGLIR